MKPAGATVMVDIHSGRGNPVVDLDAATADELYAMVAPVVVKLSEPIGDRPLVDAACLAGEAVTTSFCAEGLVHRHP